MGIINLEFKNKFCVHTFIILSILFVFHIPFTLQNNATVEPVSWVKFCRGQHQKLIHTKTCSKGVQFHRDLHLNCICAQGAWTVFSDHDCRATESSFTIIYGGKGNCFKMDKKVTRFINLGSLDTGSMYLIGKGPSTGPGHSVHITETTEPSAAIQFIERGIHDDAAKRNAKLSDFFATLVCEKQLAKFHELNPGEPTFSIYKFKNGATVIMSKFNSLACNRKFYEAGVVKLQGGSIYFNKNHTTSLSRNCHLSCQVHPAHGKKLHSIVKRAIEKPGPITPPPQPEDPTKDGLLKSKQNEATASLLRQNNAFLLYGIKENLNVSSNWILLQKANKILKTACPGLDRTIQDSMVRMFRNLYAYFKDGHYDPKEFLESDPRLERITANLEKCSSEAKKIEFKFGPPGACEKDKKVVQAKIIERTILANGSDLMLPEGEAYSKLHHDIHIESIWKMISFVHYFCAEYFFKNPFDYSTLIQMMTRFLGEDIIYRWHNPEIANKGFYAVFNSKNMLDKYAEGIDICVAIAKKISIYPVWMQRPELPNSKKGKKRTKREVKHNSNKCLTSFGSTGMELCSSPSN